MLDRNAKRKDKLEEKKNWYNSERYETLMFIQATPESTLRMQASGYDHEFRLEVLKSAKKAYENLEEREERGGRIHRPRMLDRNDRRKDRLEKKKNWYNSERYETVMFVQATPESTLQQPLQEAVNRTAILTSN